MALQSAHIRPDSLADANVAYLILYVRDLRESRDFYANQLQLEILEDDEASVKFDCGDVILWLQLASDYGVTLAGRMDDSSDVVFLVDDINRVRRDLECCGVVFVRRRTYEVGLVTDFYDPNGHRLMLYQPSATALSWPSGGKLREIWGRIGQGDAEPIGPAARPNDGAASGLRGKPLAYLFMFVPDSHAADTFYQQSLELRPIESVHCCNPACPPDEKGIVKYDVGGMLLTTHHVHKEPVVDDFGKIYSPRVVDRSHMSGIAPVFLVTDVPSLVNKLSTKGVSFEGDIVRSHLGTVAKFAADTGHTFFLYEPAEQSMKWPAGLKLEHIIANATSRGPQGNA
jgi:catechol 2,3-dioxygenase-like lactoylglutathione lyase family enzyme